VIYKALYKSEEVLLWFVGDERWTAATYCIDECALIKGLRADTTYRFRVSAINQFGQSPFSWASIEIRTKKKGTTVRLPASATAQFVTNCTLKYAIGYRADTTFHRTYF